MADFYPQGSIAMLNGDLMDVYNVTLDLTDNSKEISTLGKRGAGIVQGQEECNITFSSKIPEAGEELDYINYVKGRQIVSLRLKIPNRTMTIEGKYSAIKIDINIDDAIDIQATFVGHMTD